MYNGDDVVNNRNVTYDGRRVQLMDECGYMAHACRTVEVRDEEGRLDAWSGR
jgi:hypothetical protein